MSMNAIRGARMGVGLTQECAAEKLRVSQSAVSMWETGESLPRAELLPKIAALYNCTVDDLLREPAQDSA